MALVCTVLLGVLAVPILYLTKCLLSKEVAPVNGVYSQPGPWYTIKFWIFYAIFKLRHLKSQQSRNKKSGHAGYGMKSRSNIADMDKVQILPDVKEHPKAVDAVYFNGGDGKGTFVVAATARRQNNLIQTILYIRIPDIGLLEIPSLPDTHLISPVENSYSAGGLLIEPVEPMKTWKISFTGELRLTNLEGEISFVKSSFEFAWTALHETYFDFDTDLHWATICDAIAREKWSSEFFKGLKEAHQTHYEQFGEIKGIIEMEGFENRQISVKGVRDHSYGNIRDWSDLYRYGIQYFHLANGSSVCIGTICFPITFTRLIMGYVVQPDGKINVVSQSDFELHKWGEDGTPPLLFNINFVAGGKKYSMECQQEDAAIFFIGHDRAARIHERFCNFKLNGVRGWGISEWDYRNIEKFQI
ncbi:uncharacterized protein LOC141913314 [Tubulanus polymorphus]|uniref:uncharacterized protein LOC141913314 n=1 Tax=Tubulanus polymorphus TaxID=672921 RepID=UPI003DA2AD6A